MVGWMSYGNRKFEHLDVTMRQLIPPLQKTMLELVPMIDADTNAFNEYMVRTKTKNIFFLYVKVSYRGLLPFLACKSRMVSYFIEGLKLSHCFLQ